MDNSTLLSILHLPRGCTSRWEDVHHLHMFDFTFSSKQRVSGTTFHYILTGLRYLICYFNKRIEKCSQRTIIARFTKVNNSLMIQCSPQTTIQWRLDVVKIFILTPKSDLIMISSCERLLLDPLGPK